MTYDTPPLNPEDIIPAGINRNDQVAEYNVHACEMVLVFGLENAALIHLLVRRRVRELHSGRPGRVYHPRNSEHDLHEQLDRSKCRALGSCSDW